MSLLNGNETALINSFQPVLKVGKYRLYRVWLDRHTRYFLLDHVPYWAYRTGLKRITNKFFVCIGVFK